MSVLSAAEMGGREVRSPMARAGEVPGGRLVSLADARAARGLCRGEAAGAVRAAGGPRRGMAVPARRGTPESAGRLRLTRRGRAVLTCLAIMAVTVAATAMLFWLSVAGGAQAASHGRPAGAVHRGLSRVTVQPGQTLWAIARRAEPSADPRIVVQQIIEVNALGSPLIQPGELLWVPKG
jgi:nucleoid-associated protein YgaU